MKLSDVAGAAGLDVRREGAFASLGLLSHDAPRMLVVVYDAAYLPLALANADVACVVTTPALASSVPERFGLAVADDARTAFYAVHAHLTAATDFYGCTTSSEIHPSARIHPRAFVAERNVRIGARCVLEPGAVVLERTTLGDDVVVRANAVLGSEGFEPKDVGGRRVVVPHAGGVRIGDRVEIQALTQVARAVFGTETSIGDDTKIDACVYVAHNVRIGRRCEIAGNASVTGSATIGDDVWIGPGAVISSEVRVGDGARVSLGAVVTKDVAAGAHVTGNFAVDHARFLEFLRTIR